MNEILSVNKRIEDSIKKHWQLDALSDYKGLTLQYNDVARKIEKLHILFEEAGINKGDKIALCGRNCSHWGAAFLAVITYGAVAVPILHDFKAEQVQNIVNHSESRLLFAGEHIWPSMDAESMPKLEGVIKVQDYSLYLCRNPKLEEARKHLNKLFGQRYPKTFTAADIHYHEDQPDELALINYTSGTTSMSKGVMIPYRAMWSNIDFAEQVMGKFVKAGDNVISILPMAHMYGMAFEFIFEFVTGCHVHFLTKIPSPRVIFMAFAEIRPVIVISVPLIIEKIIRKAVLPKVQKPLMKLLLHTPFVRSKVRSKICEQVRAAFGGNFQEVIIGGAAFNQEIEQFLKSIGFNYTVGYGATECAPIITYEGWKRFVKGSCGKIVPHMEIKINSSDPNNVVGEIMVRGMNVMLGYYKNPEATAETIDKDGWYHTGDLGVLDKDGNLFIKGRCKNMLLGANGQNIYPEEIEDKLNTMPYVQECVVIQKGEKFYGLVYPDFDTLQADGHAKEELAALMETNRQEVNKLIPSYSQLSGIKIHDTEFEKTPKQSIKRFLYMNEEV